MKLFSTLNSYSTPASSLKLSKEQFSNPSQSEQEIHALHIIDDMISGLEMEAPSETSVSIIMEYARQKTSGR